MTARAFVLDVDVIGVHEARRRVLELWAPGCDLRRLTAGRWLLTLAQPREIRSERAPGLPLAGADGGLAVAGLRATAGAVTYLDGGTLRAVDLDGLEAVPTSDWFDLSDHPVRRLAPVRAADVRPVELIERVAPDPDLRRAAGLRPADTDRIGRRFGPAGIPSLRWGLIALTVAVLGAIAGSLYLAAPRHAPSRSAPHSSPAPLVPSPTPSPTPALRITLPALPGSAATGVRTFSVPQAPDSNSGYHPWAGPAAIFVIALIVRIVVPRGRRRKQAGATPAKTPGIRGWFARVVLRSPAQGFVRRRHERYLRSLTAKFERRHWQDALSEAIALGGQGGNGDWLRLRLPRRRDSLAFTAPSGTGGSVRFGESAYAHLRGLYQDAAKQLDRAGRVDEATFVYAELLRDTSAAVTLLERHDRWRTAAELAEARGLAPELLVRLWWRAGDRDRAIGIGRARGAFAAAVDRLTSLDPPAARALREEWVRACQAAGDHLGAVEAAWPEPALRRVVVADIETGIALAGPAAGQLFAYLVTERPSDDTTDRARALLATREPELRRVRDGFVATLARTPGTDPAADRKVCTAAVRSLVEQEPTRPVREQLHALGRRADPLVVADLPPLAGRSRHDDEAVDLTAPLEPAQLPVFDAVALTGRAILVAHGDLGARLVTVDGRVRARWDVPTHRITVADNGASALLVRAAGSLQDVHRLDLTTRRIRPWTVLHATGMLPSYDGGIVTVLDDDGIALLDVLSDPPRVLWREFDIAHRVLRINRTPRRLTALVDVPATPPGAERSLQLFVWELPTMTLRVRRHLPVDTEHEAAVAHGDGLTYLVAGDGTDPKLVHYAAYREPVVSAAAPGTTIVSSGSAFAVCRPLGDGRLLVTVDLDDRPAAVYATFPAGAEAIAVREHAGILTVSDRAGRIVAADTTSGQVLAELRAAL